MRIGSLEANGLQRRRTDEILRQARLLLFDRLAVRKLEICDPCIPVDRIASLVGSEVLVYIPESAVVNRIDRHARIVTPNPRVLFVSAPAIKCEASRGSLAL